MVTYLLFLSDNMAAPIVNVSGRNMLYFSCKLRSMVYYCESCIKVQCLIVNDQCLICIVQHVRLSANGKMRTCGDAGLQFKVSKVRV